MLAFLFLGCGSQAPADEGSYDAGGSGQLDAEVDSAVNSGRCTGNGLIALVDHDSNGRQQLYTVKPDGTDRRQLTFFENGDGYNGLPSWSGDGSRLVYSTTTDPASPQRDVWMMNADGSNKQLLIEDALFPAWGTNAIVYMRHSDLSLYIVDVAGDKAGAPRLLVAPGSEFFVALHPAWSRDGKTVAFAAYTTQDPDLDDVSFGCEAQSFSADVWLIDADGQNLRKLTTDDSHFNQDLAGKQLNSAFDANAPDWSPTGDQVAFWSGQEFCRGNLWKMNADGTGRVQVTFNDSTKFNNDDPAWSPDGEYLLYGTQKSMTRPELWVVRSDGSSAEDHFVTTTTPSPFPGDAAWQPRCK